MEAINLITDFPQRLSTSLREGGHVERFREMLLSLCMDELTSVDVTSQVRLRRALMLLFALLNESEASDGNNRLRRLAHSNLCLGAGAPLSIKVN